MKKITFYLAAATLAAASCSEATLTEETSAIPTPYVIRAVIGDDETTASADDSRVQLTDPDDGSLVQTWIAYDNIYVVNGTSESETAYQFTSGTEAAGKKSATFTAPSDYTGTPLYAVHMASLYVYTMNPAAWKPQYGLYETQSGNRLTSHLELACGLYAKFDTTDPGRLSFRPLQAVLRFDLTLPADASGEVTRLRLSADDGSEPFFLKPVFDLTTEPATLTQASLPSNDLLLAVESIAVPDDKRIVLYLPAAPTAAAAGKELTLEVTAGNQLYTARQQGGRITAGKCHTITKGASAWTSAETYLSGTGAADDPYRITKEEHLRTLARRTNQLGESWQNRHFLLMNDITDIRTSADDPWQPIGTMPSGDRFEIRTSFAGNFNGNGHTLSGTFHCDTNYAGLFGYALSAKIENLTVAGDLFSHYAGNNANYTGAIAGYASSELSNCHHIGSVVSTNNISDLSVGGMAGYSSGAITGCTQSGGTIEVAVSASSSAYTYLLAGGIVGQAINAKITGCRNESAIDSKSGYIGSHFVGGIAGSLSNTTAVLHTSYNSGAITFNGGAAGALVGRIINSAKAYVCSSFDPALTITKSGTQVTPTPVVGSGVALTDPCPEGHPTATP